MKIFLLMNPMGEHPNPLKNEIQALMRTALCTLMLIFCATGVTNAVAEVTATHGEQHPAGATTPSDDHTASVDTSGWAPDTKVYRRILEFSGYKWSVKAQSEPAGPGPNRFSDREEDLWVDDEGLHLTITQRDGNWYCTEVILQESFGYGTYIFHTKTEPEYVDPNVIAGMFTWDAELPWPNRELDFEFARWSDPDDPTNAQYVIQPFTTPGHWLRYRVEPDENEPYLTQVMTWQQGRVDFKTARGRFDSPQIPEEAVICAWTHTGDGVPEPRKENIRINLWLDEGEPPALDKPIDLVVSKFLYLAPEK